MPPLQPAKSSAGALSGGGLPIFVYTRLRILSGGTFTTGISANWETQFTDSGGGLTALPTNGGEVSLGTLTQGVCCDYCIIARNPSDITAWIEASAGANVQLHVNGIITEMAASASKTISLLAGFNVIRYVRAAGPITVIPSGAMWDNATSFWQSLYAQGTDPFLSSGAQQLSLAAFTGSQ